MALASQQLDDEPMFERVESFGGGVDTFRRATLLDPDQSQLLVNVLVRDDLEARTRPGADSLPTPSTPVDAGAVNGLYYFDTPQYEQLLASVNDGVGGAGIWKFEAGGWSKIAGFAPGADNRMAWDQGVDLMLLSDGAGKFQTYDGAAFTDCGNGPTDPPVGCTIVRFHAGRMFLSGLATLNDTIFVSLLLEFGSGKWDLVTRSFRIGNGDGQAVVAMASMQDFTLCVFKTNSIWLVSTDPTKLPDNYAADQDTAALSKGIGCVGRDAWCAYENDILFMAQDGVRTVQRMQAAAGQWQLTAPLSQPIQTYIDRINRDAWAGICAKKHREFAFFFVPLDNSATNNYVLVWNGRLGKWMGVFTGWNGSYVEITRFLANNKLVFGDPMGLVNEWKDTNSATDDSTYTDNGAGYPSRAWPRSMLFNDAIANKNSYSATVRFSAGNAEVNLTWMQDLAVARTWSAQPQPTGDILGVDVLPFLLASVSPVSVTRGLRGLSSFNEGFMKIECETGWFFLRNVTVGAFVNPLKDI